jgi:transcriptional regulator of heat shock response
VGSDVLVDRRHLQVSPATVRAELALLEDEGLLFHPYTSAGRIPTTAGYRYYVDHWVTSSVHPTAVTRLRTLQRNVARAEASQLVRDLAHMLAQLSGALAVVATQDALIHEAGLRNLFKTPEFMHDPDVEDVERLLEVLEDRIEEISASTEEGPQVFINGENPWLRTQRMSMVVAAPVRMSGETFVATLIGPVRMPYDRHVGLMEAVVQAFHATDRT